MKKTRLTEEQKFEVFSDALRESREFFYRGQHWNDVVRISNRAIDFCKKEHGLNAFSKTNVAVWEEAKESIFSCIG